MTTSIDIAGPQPIGGLVPAPAPEHPAELFGESRTPAGLAQEGFVTDASGLSFVRPAIIARPGTLEELRAALGTARQNHLRFAVAGTRHAMGGQALQDGSLLVDTRDLNRMQLDPASGVLTVQPGATWADVQRYLDPHGRSVAVMQSSNIFSVGGTLAVNAHGRDVRFGPVAETVESVRVLLPDGRVVTASRSQSPELFARVLGGYGLYGTIVDARIRTVPNELYRRADADVRVADFPGWWATNIRSNPDARLMQARLSIAPHSLLDEIHVVNFVRAGGEEAAALGGTLPKLDQHESWFAALWERTFFHVAERSKIGREVLWWSEQHLEPLIGGRKLVTRNQAMSPDVEFLRSGSTDHTQVLQEYFVPRERLPQFVEGLKAATLRHDVGLLNATIRDVPRDTTTRLAYAPQDSFSVVLYVEQGAGSRAQANIDQFAREVADAAVAQGGSMYLPYRLAYTDSQLAAAYPMAREFLGLRGRVDPARLLGNSVSESLARVAHL